MTEKRSIQDFLKAKKESGEKETMTEQHKPTPPANAPQTGQKTGDRDKPPTDKRTDGESRDKSKDKNPEVVDLTNPDSESHKQFEDVGDRGSDRRNTVTSATQPHPDAPVSMGALENQYLQTRNASRDLNPDFKPDLPQPLDGMRIPDGAMDPNDVKPGYGPLEGSPDFNDPTKLANPNNPNSPVNRMYNVSNPANMPQNQSQKPPSETRILGEKTLWDKRNAKDEAGQKAEGRRKELLEKVNTAIQEHELESNIPPGHEYWGLVNELRTLNNP